MLSLFLAGFLVGFMVAWEIFGRLVESNLREIHQLRAAVKPANPR